MDTRAETDSTVQRLLAHIAELKRENRQLRQALESRILIEQAKGVLAERYFLIPDQAFEAMRRAARSSGRRIHEIAREVLATAHTPPAVVREIQQPSSV
jgi:AmiR/NasT family two-component response regulator